MTAPTIVALIPARGGSVRIPHKNLAEIGGKSLLRLAIMGAQQSGVFSGIYVSTEDERIRRAAEDCGARVIDRPAQLASSLAPDIGWVRHALITTPDLINADAFAILRPTAPFRSAATIRAAWEHLRHHGSYAVDSLRAVEPARQHPLKMWLPAGALILPFADSIHHQTEPRPLAPVHSSAGQTFFPVLAQNAALEMAWSRVALDDADATISGHRVLPWTMPGHEGLDINTPDDLDYARWLVETGRATLPEVV